MRILTSLISAGKRERGNSLGFSNIRSVAKNRKYKVGPFVNLKHPLCCKISKKIKGRPLRGINKFFEKSPTKPKKGVVS